MSGGTGGSTPDGDGRSRPTRPGPDRNRRLRSRRRRPRRRVPPPESTKRVHPSPRRRPSARTATPTVDTDTDTDTNENGDADAGASASADWTSGATGAAGASTGPARATPGRTWTRFLSASDRPPRPVCRSTRSRRRARCSCTRGARPVDGSSQPPSGWPARFARGSADRPVAGADGREGDGRPIREIKYDNRVQVLGASRREPPMPRGLPAWRPAAPGAAVRVSRSSEYNTFRVRRDPRRDLHLKGCSQGYTAIVTGTGPLRIRLILLFSIVDEFKWVAGHP